MKLEDLQDAIGNLNDNIVTEAGKVRRKRTRPLRYRVVAVAAAVAIFVTGFIVIQNIRQHGELPVSPDTSKDHTVMTNISQNEPETTDKPHRAWQTDLVSGIAALAMPEYPVMHEYPSEELLYGSIDDQEAYDRAHTAWMSDRKRQRYQPQGYQDGVMAFARETNRLLLTIGNRVYSPINVYLAMSLLLETAAVIRGRNPASSRCRLDKTTIRWIPSGMHYMDDGHTTSLLASSIWLDKSCRSKKKPWRSFRTLTRRPPSKVTCGHRYGEQLQKWLNKTDNLLESNIESAAFDEGRSPLTSASSSVPSGSMNFSGQNNQRHLPFSDRPR